METSAAVNDDASRERPISSTDRSRPHYRFKRKNSVAFEIKDFARSADTEEERVDSTFFELLTVLGTGAYGKVYLVRKTKGRNIGKPFAMKVLKKATIETSAKTMEHTQAERSILEAIQKGPFLIQLHYAFQTDDKLHLILDYVSGGELFSHLARQRSFCEADARIYIAEILLAIEHLHGLGIIYRDVKLENILLDAEGHIVLTDFGLSKEIWHEGERTFSYVGTVEYMAPEIAKATGDVDGHTKAVDWWSVGVLLYELVWGHTPFAVDENDDEDTNLIILRRIVSHEPDFSGPYSPEIIDLIKKLLKKDPRERLGFGPEDAAQIKAHPFFQDINWTALREKKVIPPFRPNVQGDLDTSNFDAMFTSQEAAFSPPPRERGKLFRGFSFVAPSVLYDSKLFSDTTTGENEFLSKYTLLDETIGVGSYSICKKCVHKETGEEYAVKIISSRKCNPHREAAILKRCTGHCRFVIGIVEHFHDDLHHYIVMPIMRGGELLDRIKSKSRFTEKEAAAIFRNLIDAVNFLHRNNIVHRDIKPENLLYESEAEDSILKIVDFGFARDISECHTMQTPCFTQGYAAPEVLALASKMDPMAVPSLVDGGRSASLLAMGGYDKSCDLWSLGVILYTMLAGYPPFLSRRNMTTDSILAQIKESSFSFPDAQWKDVSTEAKDLVSGLLAINSSERLTADLAANHPWLTKHDLPIPLNIATLTSRNGQSTNVARSGPGDTGSSTEGENGTSSHPLSAATLHVGVEDCSEALKSPAVLLDEQGPVGMLKRKRSMCRVTETLNAVQRPVRLGTPHTVMAPLLSTIADTQLMRRRKQKQHKASLEAGVHSNTCSSTAPDSPQAS
eukprot:m.1020680 g.1020680  ORF g.1020680 m.1020680 type:complete len:848 (+) comp24088_c0_seq4:224-2767(+)